MKKPKKVGLLGAGNRGKRVYSNYILNNQNSIQLAAVAEPVKERQESVARKHGLDYSDVFSSWEELLENKDELDGVIIATMDQNHLDPALKALEKGLYILLEKPMATSFENLEKIARANQKYPGKILVAHVLRYTAFFQKIKELLDEEVIGTPILIQHTEKIGYYHFAHSFVRGNWRKEEESCPIILAKCCHDFDLFNWWFPQGCIELISGGELSFFHQGKKPGGAALRCFDCPLEKKCPYSASKIYLSGNKDWPVSAISEDLSPGGIKKALKDGQYGRCVFFCDNNVPDWQTVELKMEGDLQVQFALTGFSAEINRTTDIFGTEGEIRGDFLKGRIEIETFGREKKEIILSPDTGDHGGGDSGLMDNFSALLHGEELDASSWVEEALESHFLALAAERARKEKTSIKISSFKTKDDRIEKSF